MGIIIFTQNQNNYPSSQRIKDVTQETTNY